MTGRLVTDLHSFLASCRRMEDGFFATSPEVEWRLGGVLLAWSENRFAAVRKAPVDDGDYEFEGLWALPGGMVRTSGDERGCEEALRVAVEYRAVQESGILVGTSRFSPTSRLGPVVTSYTAKGFRRYTLVTAMAGDVSFPSDLSPRDRSVDAACWTDSPPNWQTFAPANRLILGHLAWSSLNEAQRDQAMGPLVEAVTQCGAWAGEIGLTPAAAPWEDGSGWQLAWP